MLFPSEEEQPLVLAVQNHKAECCHDRCDVIQGPFGPHAAKVICSDCGRFIKWVAKYHEETFA